MTGVRWTAEDGWLGKCDECRQWWPLDGDFWYPNHGLRRCRACIKASTAEAQRAKVRRKRLDPAFRDAEREALYAKRHANREGFLEWQRSYYAANKERIKAWRRMDRERKAA